MINPITKISKHTHFSSSLIHTHMQTRHFIYVSDPMASLEFSHNKSVGALMTSCFIKKKGNLYGDNTSYKGNSSMEVDHISEMSTLSDNLHKTVKIMDDAINHPHYLYYNDLNQNEKLVDSSTNLHSSTIKNKEDAKTSELSSEKKLHYDEIWHQSQESKISLSDKDITIPDFKNNQHLHDQDLNKVPKMKQDFTHSLISPPSKCVMPEALMRYYNIYQRLDSPMTASKPQFIQTFAQNGEISLENVWKAHMKLLFRNVCHRWVLHSVNFSKIFDASYLCFKDFAKVRFYCTHCKDGWTSMCGMVLFFYRCNETTNVGDIYFQILGQKCSQCNPDIFEMPIWYPEEVQKVITNLYYDVACRVYGLKTPLPIKSRRMGQPVNHHNALLCQGCLQGICKCEDQQNMIGCIPSVSYEKDAIFRSTSFNMPCSQRVPFLAPSYNPIEGTYPGFNGFSPYLSYSSSPYVASAPLSAYSEGFPPLILYYPSYAY